MQGHTEQIRQGVVHTSALVGRGLSIMDLQAGGASVYDCHPKATGAHTDAGKPKDKAGMDTYSSICVAHMTNLPAMLHFVMSSF